MKKFSIIFLLAIAAFSCQDFETDVPYKAEDVSNDASATETELQEYYWYRGEKIYLTRNSDFINVIVDGKLKKSSKSEVAANSVNASEETAKYVMPFFERGEGIEPIGTSDIFYLKLKNAGDIGILENMAAELGIQVIEEIPYTPQWYTISILGSDFSSSIEASNYFYETGQFEDVDPAFMFDFKPSADDLEFYRQWGMLSTSNYDINVVPAWTITRGAGVKVAVFDSPIQSDHTDLDDNMHSLSYNAKLKQTPSAPYNPNYYPTQSIRLANHGTRVAGIVAAEKNGSMVTGVAYESKIVRISHDFYVSNTMSSELAAGINWAWKATSTGGAGVDVINCSWGDEAGQVNQLHSTVLESAISDAMTWGRGGKGCVVVFASGNWGHTNPGRIDYPGSLHSNILVVGSIDESGSKSSFSSYGTQLDVVAPGGSIWSTIYSSTTNFDSGTSFAAPHVSGVAALILSRNPNLTRQQVTDRIEKSARKIGSYSYSTTSGRSNGSWNSQMGYGLVNAHAAVSAAINGPDYLNIYSGSVKTYSIDNPPAGTVTWEKSAGSPFTISSTTGNSTNVNMTGTGTGTLTAKVNGTVIATKSIQTSMASVTGPISGPNLVYPGYGSTVTYSLPYVPGLDYHWNNNGNLGKQDYDDEHECSFTIPSYYTGGTTDVVSCDVMIRGSSTTIGYFELDIDIY